MRALFFSTSFVGNISHSKNWARFDQKIYIGQHVKYPLFFSDFNESLIFSTNFRKILNYQISWNSVQRESSFSMRTEGQTEVTKLIVAFRNFSKAPKHDPYPFLRVLGILWQETTMSKSTLKQSFR